MGDSADSYNHRKVEPSLSYSSSYITHESASPQKTSQLKLFRKSETVVGHPDGQRRAGMLCANRSSDVSKIKRVASYNHCGSEGEMLGADQISRAGVEVEEKRTECSMCGDVGIAELLFLCSKCLLRPQHTYCGRSYPYVCGQPSICNWCLHEQDSSSLIAAKASVLCHNSSAIENSDMNARSGVDVARSVEELPNAASACVHDRYTADDATTETVARHGKAFDYLLLVAAQSRLPQVIGEACEIKKTNQGASMINSTGSKMTTSPHKKPNCESDKKATTSIKESNHGSIANETRSSEDRERSLTGLVEKLNVEIQSAGNIRVKMRNDALGGLYAGESMSKRQRCGKGMDVPAVKCGKRGLQLSPARPTYRRYKLLADVAC